eukprot:scaffold3318_cov75-Phaeocystis_antarctica.AAC.3
MVSSSTASSSSAACLAPSRVGCMPCPSRVDAIVLDAFGQMLLSLAKCSLDAFGQLQHAKRNYCNTGGATELLHG